MLKQLWDTFVGQFNKNDLTNFLTEVSHNINLQNNQFFNNALDNQGIMFQLDENATEPIDPASKLRNQILNDKKLRLKRLRERKQELTAERLKSQIERIETLEAEVGLEEFISMLKGDLANNMKFIDKVKASDKVANDSLLADLRDFISFYKYNLDQLDAAINAGAIKLSSDPTANKEIQKDIEHALRQFKIIQDFHDYALADRVKLNTKEEFKNEEVDFNIDFLMDEKAKDINGLQTYFGSPRDVSEAFTRIIYRLVGKLVITVRQLANQYGKQLINKVYQDFGGNTTTKQFAERDSNGKTTGFFLNPYNMGGFSKSLEEMREAVKNAESEEEATRIKREWNKENREGRFTQEYYDLKATLSDETNKRLDGINISIDAILNKYKKQDLTVDLTEISNQDWKLLQQARIARKRLANLYYQDGTKKSGLDLDVALELKNYYEKYWENVNYKPNMEAFEAAKAKVPKNKSKLWYERNTEIQYTKEFWDLFNELNKRDYGDEYTELNEERLELLRPFRVDNQELDVNNLPEEIKNRVKWIDAKLNEIRESTPKEKLSGLKFSDIATIVKTDEYEAAKKQAAKDGRLDEWMAENHYHTSKGL